MVDIFSAVGSSLWVAAVVLLCSIGGIVWLIYRSVSQNECVEASFMCQLFGFTFKTKNPRRRN